MLTIRASGWHPDLPDRRDYTWAHERVAAQLRILPPLALNPSRVDWRSFCSSCPQQGDGEQADGEQGERDDRGAGDRGKGARRGGDRGSIHCCLELLEQTLYRLQGKRPVFSRRFVHYNAWRTARAEGGPPLAIRTVWKSIRRIGVVVDAFCRAEVQEPPSLRHSRSAPDAFSYSAACRFPQLHYVRLDRCGQPGSETLASLRSCLAAGFLCVFGIPLSRSAGEEGEIAFPTVFDDLQGGQALLAVGYDDHRRLRSDRGCLLVRGSWGREWGEEGYGWLPYSYLQEKLAMDFWTIFTPEWLASGEYQSPLGPLPEP
ncbi:C1 family peptidase [Candidatus Laterigemmans baculatus]|uniref:C1 family peptidase n=1 Tax=Candidatus Laterigemmans baculatus TaxID=2770505 RepID=UPI0013D9C6CC|nr:C1 family peptidase [Candidatus Laterigemmans baculatus]